MNKKTILLLLGLIMSNLSIGQDIISTPFIVNGVVNLGESAGVQFTVNQETICDNYTIDWQVDYTAKIVNITVNYNYFSNCNNSTASFVETPQNEFLLLGIYTVNLNLNVIANPIWNQTFNLGAISVVEPNQISCSSANIPIVQEFCPTNFNLVCACNGVTYDNECIAYLEEENGIFIQTTCLNYLQSNEQTFECLTYNSSNNDNFFEQYSCETEAFAGDELIFSYQPELLTTGMIEFTSPAADVKLFLISMVDNNLACIASSENNILTHGPLEEGIYYLIADRIETSDFMITFCEDPTSITGLNQDSKTIVFPNPAKNELNIFSPTHKIKEIECYNSLGQLKLKKTINDHRFHLSNPNFKGVYFLSILYDDHIKESIKVIFE